MICYVQTSLTTNPENGFVKITVMYCVQLKQIDRFPSSIDIHKPDDLGSETDVEPMSRPLRKPARHSQSYTNTIQIIYLLSTCIAVPRVHALESYGSIEVREPAGIQSRVNTCRN